jgi:hypothetical protein
MPQHLGDAPQGSTSLPQAIDEQNPPALDHVRTWLDGRRQQWRRSCNGTFFICCVAVALIAADAKDGTPRLAAIPSAMSTAGCVSRCNEGGGATTPSISLLHRSVMKATAVSTMSFGFPFRYFS